jgi:hypothetical protein
VRRLADASFCAALARACQSRNGQYALVHDGEPSRYSVGVFGQGPTHGHRQPRKPITLSAFAGGGWWRSLRLTDTGRRETPGPCGVGLPPSPSPRVPLAVPSEGRVDHGHSAVAEGVRAATASNIGANPTLRPRAFGGRSPSSLRNASHGWPQGVGTTRTIRLPHHDLYAGRGKPASPYGVSDDGGPPAALLNL